jgi:hypothetical protein
VRPTRIALFGSGVTRISGVPFDEVGLEVEELVVVRERREDASLACWTAAGRRPRR